MGALGCRVDGGGHKGIGAYGRQHIQPQSMHGRWNQINSAHTSQPLINKAQPCFRAQQKQAMRQRAAPCLSRERQCIGGTVVRVVQLKRTYDVMCCHGLVRKVGFRVPGIKAAGGQKSIDRCPALTVEVPGQGHPAGTRGAARALLRIPRVGG